MCLAVPVRIQTIEGDTGEIELGGVKRRISLILTPEARIGNYVLVHAGYAIGILDEEAANETLHLLEEMAGLAGADDKT